MKIEKITIRKNSPSEINVMFDIWERAVKATHHFLSEEDILNIGIQVKDYLTQASFAVAVDSTEKVLGFMGMSENKIDSLFIHPTYFGLGVGRAFIEHALSLYPELLVDVNEDNLQAKLFYEKMGFQTFERSELDDEGRPFPILKMKRPSLNISF